MNNFQKQSSIPVIGILAWESELEQIPGSIIHPETFNFPVIINRVKGACYETVVLKPTQDILRQFIKAAKELEGEKVEYIISTAGLTAIFQKQVSDSVKIPVLMSSLFLVPLVMCMLGAKQKVGIITAHTNYLSTEHFNVANIEPSSVCIIGIENTAEFSNLAINPTQIKDPKSYELEIVSIAKKLLEDKENIGAIVIEVTGLCPFSASIRQALSLPVFDIVELSYLLYGSLFNNRWK